MLQVWTPVKVKTEEHERAGEAGTVHQTDAQDHPLDVVVKFDRDGALVSVAIADLQAL